MVVNGDFNSVKNDQMADFNPENVDTIPDPYFIFFKPFID